MPVGWSRRKLLSSHVLWQKAALRSFAHTHLLRAVPVTIPSDDRSPAAKAYQWASRIMIVSLEMVLPGLAGYWFDQQVGSRVVFMLIGFGLGSTGAVMHLIRMTRLDQDRTRNNHAD
jgi:hypothetical protein